MTQNINIKICRSTRFEKAQPKQYNTVKSIYSLSYIIHYQFIISVAFWLRFGCVLVAKGATVAQFVKVRISKTQPEPLVAPILQPFFCCN